MARAKGPALYELLKDGQNSKLSAPLPARGNVSVSSGAIGEQRWFARAPLALGIGAVVLVVVIVAVLIGPGGGGGSSDEAADAPRSVPVDPLAARPVLVNPAPPAAIGGSQPVSTPTAQTTATAHPQAGMTYLVVAHLGQAEAGQLVAFLAANGLEGFSIPSNNARLHRVMVLPAMATRADWNGPAGRGLMDRVKSLGTQWKRGNRGNSDFHDAYWDTY